MCAERRALKRYVVDGLLLEIGGVEHETIDISARSVAALRMPGVNYRDLKAPFRFKSRKTAEIDQSVSALKIIGERAATIVLEYRLKNPAWEATLRRHDVRAGERLEDVFG